MTLHEVEKTVQTLTSRHEGLDEAMLVTMLHAGGWEENEIKDAVTIFRSKEKLQRNDSQEKKDVHGSGDQEQLLVSGVENSHLLTSHTVEVPLVIEPQSLVSPSFNKEEGKHEELPHNLPLRPFETSEHVWPFSRYRDVFYGDQEFDKEQPPVIKEEVKEHIILPESPPVPVVPVVVEEQKSIPPLPVKVPEPVYYAPPEKIPIEEPKPPVFVRPSIPVTTPNSSGGEERLVITACIMLVIILLLLGYMYSNGRL